MRARVVAVACTCLLACGPEAPEPVEPAELAELCGQTEPVRLLHYAPWRVVEAGWPVGVFGDRRLVIVRYADSTAAPLVLSSVGLCGEEPRQLLSGRFGVWTIPGQDWPFACKDQSGELYVIDPSGERAPRLVGRLSFGCNAVRTEVGLFGIRPHSADSVTGDFVSYSWPNDIWTDELEPVILHDDVKLYDPTADQSWWDALQGGDDELFFVTASDELMRMSTDDGTTETVALDVRTFELGRERDDSEQGYSQRYVVWQDNHPTNGDSEVQEGELLLLDRTTKQTSSLGYGALTSAHLRATNWSTSGLLQLPMHVDDELVLRLFQLPSLSHVDVPATIQPNFMLDDDRHLVVRFGEEGPFGTLDVQTGETVSFEKLFSNPRYGYWYEQRVLLLFPGAGSAPLAEGEVWLVRDGEPELFAKRATHLHRLLPDGRLLTGINLNGDGVGDLIVVDDFEARLIEQGVSMSFIGAMPDAGDDTVSYSIREGDRAGLWLARLPPKN